MKTCHEHVTRLSNVYVLFGGYSVLQIALYGYIGDVTTNKWVGH